MDALNLRKGELTRLRIIEAAYQQFMDKGYHATSMRQIAEHAGIALGSTYAHFASKEAIWEAVFEAKHPYHDILPLIKSVEGDTVAEFVHRAAKQLIEALGQQDDLLNLMFTEIVEFKGKHIASIFKDVLPEMVNLRQMFIQKKGNLRPVALPILARFFAGLFISYYVTDILMPNDIRSQMGLDPLEDFVHIFLYGILDEPAETPHA